MGLSAGWDALASKKGMRIPPRRKVEEDRKGGKKEESWHLGADPRGKGKPGLESNLEKKPERKRPKKWIWNGAGGLVRKKENLQESAPARFEKRPDTLAWAAPEKGNPRT